MSGFLVCWSREGARVPDRLREVAGRHGRREARRLDRGDVVAWHWPGSWAPGAEDALPLERDGWVGSAVLRLDDRRALGDRLRDASSPGPDDDATLAWRALAAWGEDAPAQWIGDVVLAAVAPARARLVIARSGVGVRSVFHRAVDGVECVSDDLALLCRFGPAPPLEERAVVEFLRLGHVATAGLTFHSGIRRLRSWETVVVARDGSVRSRLHRTLPVAPPRHGRPDGELLEGFRDVLGTAVADRLRGPRASLLLSGGLDSTAVAVAAGDRAPGVALTGVTFSWHALLGDDEAAVARSAAEALRLPHVVVEQGATEASPALARFWSPEPLPDPDPALWRAQAARLAAIAPVALLGEDGDALLAPATLLEQVRADGVAHTWRSWRAFRAETGERPWAGLRRSLRWLERRRSARQARPPRWLRPEVVGRFPLPAPAASPHPWRSLAARSLGDPLWDAICWLDDPRMSGADLTVLLPLMDPRVVAFCLTLPSVPWLQRKAVVRRAMRGRLPEAVLARAKTPLRGLVEARVRAWRASDAARGGQVAQASEVLAPWIDAGRWRDALVGTDAEQAWTAWRALELARWLTQPAEDAR